MAKWWMGLAACGFQLVACGLWLVACSLQLVACGFQLVACSLSLMPYTLHPSSQLTKKSYFHTLDEVKTAKNFISKICEEACATTVKRGSSTKGLYS
jgi:hypothetical protein